MNAPNITGRLRWLLLGCTASLFAAAIALAVNTELAIRVFVPDVRVVEKLLSPGLFAWLAPLGADLSGVSTVVPVLLFAFPLWHGWRRNSDLRRDPAAESTRIDPYPEHFPFFCIMLGLFGTLYGMMLGLSSSGVSGLAVSSPSAESIRVALDRLLSGTATALLSSIVGMIGAFLAAQPFPAIFRWCTGASEAGEDVDIITSIAQVTSELKALALAGAEARQQWGGVGIGPILDRLEKIQMASEHSATASVQMQESIATLVRSHDRFTESMIEGARAIQLSVTQLAAGVEVLTRCEPAHRNAMEQIVQSGQAVVDRLRQMENGLNQQHNAALSEWKALREETTRQADESRRDRAALRRALASYAEPSDER